VLRPWFVVIFITLIYGATLPGAGKGLKEYFTPDWSALAKSDVWIDAIGQLFFGLTLAMGTSQAYGRAPYTTCRGIRAFRGACLHCFDES